MKRSCQNIIPTVPAIIFVAGLVFLSGCGQPSVSSKEQVRKFNRTGAIRHLGDTQQSNEELNSKYQCVYRVAPGDVLELTMPETMQETSWESMKNASRDKPYYCRISEDGTITLPVVGALQIAGMTTSQVEAIVVESHYPRYVTRPPAVVCNVEEHRDERTFAVMGLVNKPDSFEYPPNARLTLTDAIAMAGGTNIIANPHYATIYRQDSKGEIVPATFRIDSSKLAKASKVLIEPGDIISVDRSIGTEMNMVLDRILNFGIGTTVTP